MEPDIPEDVIQSIEDDVRKLIHSLTSYEVYFLLQRTTSTNSEVYYVHSIFTSQPDSDNFKQCAEFTMYQILCQKHQIPSETSTRESLDEYVFRYNCEGLSKSAGIFEESLRGYLGDGANDKKTQVRYH